MLSTLVQHGFVQKCPESGFYRLGRKLWGLGMTALGDRDLSEAARPHLRRLMEKSQETVNLAVPLEGLASIMYIEKVDGPQIVRVNTSVGLVSPSWCTATGRSMLANRKDAWDSVLSKPLKKITPHTVTDPKRIRAELEKTRMNGFAITHGERSLENSGIAAPILDYSGEVIAACGVALPTFRMSKAVTIRCIPIVMEAAAAISAALGWRPDGKQEASR
jgi:DNA-binding IclR family transcriptional regulator